MSHQPLLNISNLTIKLPERTLFEKLSFSVGRGEVIALVGGNGCGKSTLLRLIEQSWQSGSVSRPSDEIKVTGGVQLSSSVDVAHLPQQIEDSGTSKESDGQRQKKAIADVLASGADLLLFDEPTNYLDIDGIVAFESGMDERRAGGTGILMVSHDRQLINNLVDRTVYFTPNGVYQTKGGYASAQSLAQSEYDAKRHQAANIGGKIKKLETEARSRMNWAGSKEKSKRGAGAAKPHIGKMAAKMAARAKAAQQKAEKEIARLEKTKPFVPKPVKLRLPEYEVRNRNVFTFEDTGFRYGQESAPEVLREISFGASTTDRICLMGGNGSGKSTLLKLIVNQLKVTTGKFRSNESVRVSYLPQGLRGFFSGKSLLEAFADVTADEATVRTLLGGVMIRGEKVHQSLASLSPGELTRAALVKAMVSRAEFLLFDEPTSHLDVESVEVLEQALSQFPGGYLVVSHDRSFVESVADKLYLIEEGRLKLV